jgi:hypothetical protein
VLFAIGLVIILGAIYWAIISVYDGSAQVAISVGRDNEISSEKNYFGFGFVNKVKSLMAIFEAWRSFCSLTPTIGSLQFGHN